MKGGYADKVDADWNEAIDKRAARDEKLEADFEAKYAERGKELEAAKIKDPERNRKAGAGEGSPVVVTENVNVDQRQQNYNTDSTTVPDSVRLEAIMQAG